MGIIMLHSCSKELDYSIIPAIEFKDLQVFKNANGRDQYIKMTIGYIDGDGDLGLKQSDTFPPYHQESNYYYNMFIDYYEYVDGKFIQVRPEVSGIPIGDTIRFLYRFPYLSPATGSKALKGEIEWTSDQIPVIKSNTVRFSVYIYDRALNKSNKVITPPITFYP
jgi:hypothetical protein